MTEFPRSDARSEERPPGTWKPLIVDGGASATVSCPKCGNVSTLEGHLIKPDGAVDPSIVCPWPTVGCNACDWHDTVKLVGWPEYLSKFKERLT